MKAQLMVGGDLEAGRTSFARVDMTNEVTSLTLNAGDFGLGGFFFSFFSCAGSNMQGTKTAWQTWRVDRWSERRIGG